jgi:tRNA pseudouridine55 synthase
LSGLLLNADKRYRARVKLGEETDTMDRTGTVTTTAPVPPLTPADIDRVMETFRGEWHQTPPMYSAKKLKGVRLYELARQNISVQREPIPVQLYELKLLSYEAPFLEFEVHCSKGTYVRSLAAELGQRLGTVGHLAELRRLACGEFRAEESVTVEQLGQDLNASLEQGRRNYARLLRAEGLFRRLTPTAPRTPFHPTGSVGEARSSGHSLQMPNNHGKSLLT